MPYIFVVGNEKGGAGKTTCCMHLIAALLDRFSVASIDADGRQGSLTRYIENRTRYNASSRLKVPVPTHVRLNISSLEDAQAARQAEKDEFMRALDQCSSADIIVIDTPGSNSFLSQLAHSHADTIITPINDSFVDLDVMARIDPSSLKVISPSIYSQMVWEQKINKAQRGGRPIDWVVMRNRRTNTDTNNKRQITTVLTELAKRISFRQIDGFNERVIYRELFLDGLTLLDLKKVRYGKAFTLSHVAARQELRDFVKAVCVNLDKDFDYA